MKMNAMFYGRWWNIIYSNEQFCSINTWAHLEEHALVLLSYNQYFTNPAYDLSILALIPQNRMNNKKRVSVYEGIWHGSLELPRSALCSLFLNSSKVLSCLLPYNVDFGVICIQKISVFSSSTSCGAALDIVTDDCPSWCNARKVNQFFLRLNWQEQELNICQPSCTFYSRGP